MDPGGSRPGGKACKWDDWDHGRNLNMNYRLGNSVMSALNVIVLSKYTLNI